MLSDISKISVEKPRYVIFSIAVKNDWKIGISGLSDDRYPTFSMLVCKRLADWISGLSEYRCPTFLMLVYKSLKDWLSGLSVDQIFPMPVYFDWQTGFLNYLMVEN